MQCSREDPTAGRRRTLGYIKGTAAWVLAAVSALLIGCSAPSTSNHNAAARPQVPAADSVRYRIDDGRSEVLIWVRSEGPLAYLGHNHIIQVAQLSGELWLPPDPQR